MAPTFASTITEQWVAGNKRHAKGTFTGAGGSVGGDIDTGLRYVEALSMTPTGAAIAADQCAVNEVFPIVGPNVTVVTTANTVGNWEAHGR